MRNANVSRTTRETDISINIDLDGSGKYEISTGCGFLDHMLELFACHSRYDLKITCKGDTHVDYHHTVEDVGILLGQAIAQALGERKGIRRYGSFILPMDEALVLCAIDLDGRGHLNFGVTLPTQRVGDFDTELVQEFFLGFMRNLKASIHIKQLEGENTHHILEAIFKGIARTLKEATSIDLELKDEIPSSKGIL